MSQLTFADLKSPVSLPERKIGKYRIKHKYLKDFDIVSLREALMTGKAPQKVHLDEPVRIHGLHDEDGMWIADWPIEVRQHKEAIQRMMASGRVLVGGLGLGIAATLLAKDPKVTQVDVVEISPEVAELCDPHNPKVRVIVQDLMKYIKGLSEWPYDSAFIDIWRGTNEGAWWEEVMPIRRLLANKFGKWQTDGVFYWAEDIMLGQVLAQLTRATPPHWYYRQELHLPMSRQRVTWFFKNIGTPLWETRYGKLYPR